MGRKEDGHEAQSADCSGALAQRTAAATASSSLRSGECSALAQEGQGTAAAQRGQARVDRSKAFGLALGLHHCVAGSKVDVQILVTAQQGGMAHAGACRLQRGSRTGSRRRRRKGVMRKGGMRAQARVDRSGAFRLALRLHHLLAGSKLDLQILI